MLSRTIRHSRLASSGPIERSAIYEFLMLLPIPGEQLPLLKRGKCAQASCFPNARSQQHLGVPLRVHVLQRGMALCPYRTRPRTPEARRAFMASRRPSRKATTRAVSPTSLRAPMSAPAALGNADYPRADIPGRHVPRRAPKVVANAPVRTRLVRQVERHDSLRCHHSSSIVH